MNNQLARPLLVLVYCIAVATCAFLSRTGFGGEPIGLDAIPVTATSNEEGVEFKQGRAKILFYQRRPKSHDGKYERANYIHPLYDVDGNILTEDFPGDHLHHRGVFWAWHQLRVGDARAGDGWEAKNFSWTVQQAAITPDNGKFAALDVELTWSSPLIADANGAARPLVKEATTIRVHRAERDARKIDFEIRLLAARKNTWIGGAENDKGYGGFSTRIRLPEGIQFVAQAGPVTPARTPVDAGSWLDMTARFGSSDAKSGLAILCHPSLPNFPQPWILRKKGSMQNPVFPGRHAIALPTEKPLVLRYRLVVHRGATEQARMRAWQDEYEWVQD